MVKAVVEGCHHWGYEREGFLFLSSFEALVPVT